MITIEPESIEHAAAIRLITTDAFSNSELGHNGEADLVDALRTQCNDSLSLVALDQGQVVGHVLFTPATIRKADQELYGMGLAPISVKTTHQRKGIGSALIAAGLQRLSAVDCKFVVVIGHREFYLRFGFEAAAEYGITHGFDGMPQDVLFIHSEDPKSLSPFRGGTVYYCDEFGSQG